MSRTCDDIFPFAATKKRPEGRFYPRLTADMGTLRSAEAVHASLMGKLS